MNRGRFESCEPIPEVTPTDELTGLPLPIVPHDDVLPLLDHPRLNMARRQAGEPYIDRQHLWHPKRAEELTSPDGLAVRDSSIQMVMREDHNRYHRAYSGPPLPQTGADRFRMVLLGVAGHVPRQAIDLSGYSSRIVSMSDAQVTRLQTSGEMRLAQEVNVRSFMERYVLANLTIGHIPDGVIDEFLSIQPSDEQKLQRRQFLAHKLLSMVIEPATEPLDDVLRVAREDRPRQRQAPINPRDVVHSMLIGRGQRKRRQSIHRIGNILFEALAEQRALSSVA